MKKKGRVFSGVQPSGAQVHLGNYLGAMKHFVSLSKQYETIVCVVDLHALTSVKEPELLSRYTYSLASAYLAIGLDPQEITIFKQSDVTEVCELTWYLACNFPFGLLERAHSLKDARAKGISFNSGVAFYPILMAADILLYKATKIPVGADQKQHIEMTREIAIKLNNQYKKELFPIPEPVIDENTGVIPGLDGRKMSKSYDNYIGLFGSEKETKKKVMSIVTDSKELEEIKDPDTCNIFQLYRLFADDKETESLKQRYLAGGMGYGHAKLEFLNLLEREIAPLRESYNSWMSRESDLRDILDSGAKKAKIIAHETMSEVRDVLGIV